MATLYLVPNLLGETPWEQVLPPATVELVSRLSFFIAEDVRNTRRFLKKLNPAINIDGLTFFELNKHTTALQQNSYLEPLLEGNDMAVISEAGCPGVADPGADLVRAAHRKNIRVVPLSGPSSILLALMASGMNGQNFAFTGYLPLKQPERNRRIQLLEKNAEQLGQTQIFMETPYRNNTLLADLMKTCQPATLLCIAADITSENEFIATRTIAEWKKNLPNLDKHPAIFLLYRNEGND